jgi:DNA-binding transcriptional MerR regulator
MSKSPDAFRTISEVAEDLNLPQHVLRFWETRFNQIKPLKRGGGRRYYRPEDVDLLRGIKHLLYDEGYTIRGLQRILREQGNRFVIASVNDDSAAEVRAQAMRQPQAPETDAETLEELADEFPGAPAPGQKAVPVQSYYDPDAHRPAGLLARLRGETGGQPRLSPVKFTPDDRRALQETLYELLECKRLLDQVRG